jgi:DNA-binding NarL/FixJ family response regulator
MPYDAALALVASGDADLARRGLDVLDRLGADAVGAKVRRDLRARGVSVVPARRRSTTLTNPAGLTTRQIDVLRLMGDGLTNAELAERLYLSVKTIDKHVSAILAKLQTANRRDAVRRARGRDFRLNPIPATALLRAASRPSTKRVRPSTRTSHLVRRCRWQRSVRSVKPA